MIDPTRRKIVEGEPGIFPPGFAHPWRTVWRWITRRKRPEGVTTDDPAPEGGAGGG
jgi:hypothetical protein